MFFKIGALKNLAIFKGKHLCWSLFLIKLQACNFPVNVAKFLKNSFFHKTPSAAASEKFINFRGKHQWRRCNRSIFLIRQYVNVLLTLISERFSRRDLKSQWLSYFSIEMRRCRKLYRAKAAQAEQNLSLSSRSTIEVTT